VDADSEKPAALLSDPLRSKPVCDVLLDTDWIPDDAKKKQVSRPP
jgi:hypothetical protein